MSATDFKNACERLRCNDPTFVSLKDDFYHQYMNVLFRNASNIRLFTSSLAANTMLEELSLDGALLFVRPVTMTATMALENDEYDEDLDLIVQHIQYNKMLRSLRMRWCTQPRLLVAIGRFATAKSIELTAQRQVDLEPLLSGRFERIKVESKSQILGLKPLVRQNCSASWSLRDLCITGRLAVDDFKFLCESLNQPQSQLTKLQVVVDSREKAAILGSTLQSPFCSLTELDLTQSSLDDSDSIRAILGGLASNTSLCALNMTKCKLGHSLDGLDTAIWSSCFEQNTTLRSLNLSWNFLQTSGDAAVLSQVLPKSASLQDLNLQWNLVSNVDCLSWCQHILPAMHTVRLSAIELSDADAALAISHALLSDQSKLRVLEIGRLWFTEQEQEGMQTVLEAIVDPKNRLECLSMTNFGHGPGQVCDLLMRLASNKSLRDLTLLDSKYDPKVCDNALCHLLENNTTLVKLEIGKNEQFTASTVQSLAKGVRANRHLKRLRICHCPQLEDWSTLFESLQQNTVLEELDIQNGPNNGKIVFEQISRALADIRGLKKLIFSGPSDYKPTAEEVNAFLAALEVNISLESINVSLPSVCQSTEMKRWLTLNKAGRRILQHTDSMPLGLWTHIFARSLTATPVDVSQTYYLMRQGLVAHQSNLL